jgi:hypothetical protein
MRKTTTSKAEKARLLRLYENRGEFWKNFTTDQRGSKEVVFILDEIDRRGKSLQEQAAQQAKADRKQAKADRKQAAIANAAAAAKAKADRVTAKGKAMDDRAAILAERKARGAEGRRITNRNAQRKYMADPINRLSNRVSTNLRTRLRGIGFVKGRRSWESLLGYTAGELRVHLENQFQRGMTWANYGKWHIDHIAPVASFRECSEEEFFQNCWSLKNLRPLWAAENQSRGGKMKRLRIAEKGQNTGVV